MNVSQFYQEIKVDYKDALSRMMNDMFVARMISKFYASNSYNDLINAYNNKDFKSVFSHAHAFKGVLGNLSLTSLFKITSVITEATRDNDNPNIDNEIKILKERYQIFLDAYHKYIEV